MFSNLRAALNEEVQRRDTVDTLVAGQLEALQSQMPTLNSNLSALNTQLQFQQGALANSRDEAERQRNDMLTTIESLSATVASIRNHLVTITPTMAGSPQAPPDRPTLVPGTSLLHEVLQANAEDSINARIESLQEAIAASMSDLRGQVLTVNDQLSARVQEQLQELNEKVETLESNTAAAAADAAAAAAMIVAVDGTAQEAVARLSEADQRSDPWSEWDLLQCQEFHELEGRVAALETGTASGPVQSEATPLTAKLEEALERIADSRVEPPEATLGASLATPSHVREGARQ